MAAISVPFYCIMHVLYNVVCLCNTAFVIGCQSPINVCLFVIDPLTSLRVWSGNTPLIYSARVGNDVAIGVLIRSFRRLGLNVNHLNDDRQTALLVAARQGFLECAALLATDGRADVTVRDPATGRTAEEWARTRGCSTPEVLPFAVLSAQARYDTIRYDTECLLLARLMGQYCFARWRLSSVVVLCNAAGGRPTVGQYRYARLGRHLVKIAIKIKTNTRHLYRALR